MDCCRRTSGCKSGFWVLVGGESGMLHWYRCSSSASLQLSCTSSTRSWSSGSAAEPVELSLRGLQGCAKAMFAVALRLRKWTAPMGAPTPTLPSAPVAMLPAATPIASEDCEMGTSGGFEGGGELGAGACTTIFGAGCFAGGAELELNGTGDESELGSEAGGSRGG